MTAINVSRLPDVQQRADERGVGIDEVGIGGFAFPLQVEMRDGSTQPSIGDAELVVGLSASERGTHMSRFVEAVNGLSAPVSAPVVANLAEDLRERLQAETASVRLRLSLFLERRAPVSGLAAPMRFGATYRANAEGGNPAMRTAVEVPVTSLCPCSKEISDYGAHSQRGYVRIEVGSAGPGSDLWPEDLISIADSAASSPIYPLLKREDERAVTMNAYDHPAFVEDLARDVAVALRQDARVAWFGLEVENQESIHDHAAIARVRWTRDGH